MTATPTAAVTAVTPALAAAWLNASNTRNRNLRPGLVAAYARDMAAGDWSFNGEAIKFDKAGTLLDGQHRLSAIVESATTQTMLVITDLPTEAQATMDTGAKRQVGDQLTLRGEINGMALAAVARRVLLLDRGITATGGNSAPTSPEIIRFIEAHPELRRASEVGARAKGKVLAAPSSLAAAFYNCAQVDKSAAELFYVTQVIDGIGLAEGDPALALAKKFQMEMVSTGRQMHADNVYRFSILAWNKYRAGVPVYKLQAPRNGWTVTPLPV